MLSAMRAVTIVLATWLASPLFAQDVPAEDPRIPEKIDRLRDAFKDRRMQRDAEAAEVLTELAADVERGLHPADAKRVLRSTTRVLTRGKLRPSNATLIYEKTIVVLSKLGPNGAKVLRAAYDKKRFPRKPEWVAMRARLVAGVGETGDEKSVDFLISRARGAYEPEVLAAAGRALVHFKDADLKTRKTIVKTLATKLSSLEAESVRPVSLSPGEQPDFGPQNAREMLEAIEGPWLSTLSKLTGQSLPDGSAWQKWYNKNKHKDWDAQRGQEGH